MYSNYIFRILLNDWSKLQIIYDQSQIFPHFISSKETNKNQLISGSVLLFNTNAPVRSVISVEKYIQIAHENAIYSPKGIYVCASRWMQRTFKRGRLSRSLSCGGLESSFKAALRQREREMHTWTWTSRLVSKYTPFWLSQDRSQAYSSWERDWVL